MYIVRAAIMYPNGETVEGHNYGEIISLGTKLGFSGERIEGFTTTTDEFLLPDEAAKLALESRQIDRKVSKLFPEHLWPCTMMEWTC